MAADHSRAYSNTTSPLGAAELMDRLFTDSLVSREKQDFIKEALRECTTGKDRIAAPLAGKEGVCIAHKTALAVFVKDFRGTEQQASEVIARISAAVYSILEQALQGRTGASARFPDETEAVEVPAQRSGAACPTGAVTAGDWG